MTAADLTPPELDISTGPGWGHILLNRPKAINALTTAMVQEMSRTLDAWAADPNIRIVIVEGSGERGLCAGADIKALAAGTQDDAIEFLHNEYALNAQIAEFPKPYIALMDGIVMGGGMGISMHANTRIVTERTQLAMPEAGIGLVVDAGGTFRLGRMPGNSGLHVGLTGYRMSGADAIWADLADYHVPSERLPALVQVLKDHAGGDDMNLGDLLTEVATYPGISKLGELAEHADWIKNAYAQPSLAKVIEALAAVDNPPAREISKTLAAQCPTSLAVIWSAIRSARDLSLRQAVSQELYISTRMTLRSDFREGVRAQVIDKDRNPRWSPATLAEVSAEALAALLPEDPSELPALQHPDAGPTPVAARAS